jgi:hypothetical protein
MCTLAPQLCPDIRNICIAVAGNSDAIISFYFPLGAFTLHTLIETQILFALVVREAASMTKLYFMRLKARLSTIYGADAANGSQTELDALNSTGCTHG